MALEFNALKNKVIGRKDESTLGHLIIDCLELKQKLEAIDDQSWYFKKSTEAKQRRLSSLTHEYNAIRTLFNENTVDFFIHAIAENEERIVYFEKLTPRFIRQIALDSLRGKNAFFNELIWLKSKTASIAPLPYYADHPEEILKFIE